MTRKQIRKIALIVGIGVVVAGGVLIAGPLDPPAGPIAPTYKTLSEVEPRTAINSTNTTGDATCLFKITQPGSYYLTGNIAGVAGKHGIFITTSNVTLDLNNFHVVGVAGGSAIGVYGSTASNLRNCVVLNGTVRGWASSGISMVTAVNARVSGVNASDNGSTGISAGYTAVVSHCTALNNGSDGIGVATGCSVIGCVAGDNARFGITAAASATVTACSATYNEFTGIHVGVGSTVADCAASYNGDDGISIAAGFVVAGGAVSSCTAYENDSNGIFSSSDCTVSGCTSRSNGVAGIAVGTGSSVIGCEASDNATGISVGTSCTVTSCTVLGNTSSSGIVVGAGSSVSGCTSGNNVGDGIVASSNCQIRGNTCAGNGANPGNSANIYLSGTLNRVEDNVCTGADVGIMTVGARNVFSRNTCGNNTTNWSIAAGNVALVVNAVTGGAFSGNTGGVAPGSTDPNANFSY